MPNEVEDEASMTVNLLERSRQPVPMAVAGRIQDLIRDGIHPPGSRLPSQRTLAQRLKVSRASLREALSVLETLGVIRIEAGRGVFVEAAEPDPQIDRQWRFSDHYTAREVYQTRLWLEAAAAELAVVRMDLAAVSALADITSALKAAVEAGDVVEAARQDTVFHDALLAACGNRMMQQIYASLRSFLVESQRLPMARRATLWQTVREHEAILKAISVHDPDETRDAMAAHIRAAARRADIAI